MVAARDADPVRLEQHPAVGEALRRLEPIRGQLDRESERVVEVDESMKPLSLTPLCSIPRASRRSTAWSNVALESETAMWWTQPGSVGVARIGRPVLVREHGDQPAVARVEVQVALARVVEIGLLEDDGIPSSPSQKSIDVCRSAPTSVMWWTP